MTERGFRTFSRVVDPLFNQTDREARWEETARIDDPNNHRENSIYQPIGGKKRIKSKRKRTRKSKRKKTRKSKRKNQ